MPKDLQGEYPSLKKIQHQKRNAEKSFDIALEQFKAKSQKLQEQQEKMSKFQSYMLEYENTQKDVETTNMDGRHLIGREAFKERLESVNAMQSILREVDQIENENVT